MTEDQERIQALEEKVLQLERDMQAIKDSLDNAKIEVLT